MKKNMGAVDRAVRTVAAVVIALLVFLGVVQGTPATILVILAVVLILTSIVGTCPAYLPFGISTCKPA